MNKEGHLGLVQPSDNPIEKIQMKIEDEGGSRSPDNSI